MQNGASSKKKIKSTETDRNYEHAFESSFRECKFQPYQTFIDELNASSINEQIADWFAMLFNANPAVTEKSIKVDVFLITKVACGIVEEIPAAEILHLLIKLYPSLDENARLASIYLVKELIKQDSDQQWCCSLEFDDAFKQFIDVIDTSNYALYTLKNKICEYYEDKKQNDPEVKKSPISEKWADFSTNIIIIKDKKQRKQWAKLFVSDVNNLFCQGLIALTPLQMFTVNIIKRADSNQPWLAYTALCNKLTHWVSKDILSTEVRELRVKKVEFYLECLKYFIDNKHINLGGAFCIYNALQHTTVSRLPEVKKQIGTESFKKYIELFGFSKNFEKLREFILLHRHCIPQMSIIGSDKSFYSEKALNSRILMNGEINHKHIQLREFLKTLPPFQLQCNIQTQLDEFEPNEGLQYKLSYSIEPPLVIDLEENLTDEILLVKVQAFTIKSAPLVVKINENRYFQEEAKQMILLTRSTALTSQYQILGMETDDPLIMACDLAINKFAQLGSVVVKPCPMAIEEKIEQIADNFSDLTLNTTSLSNTRKVRRSKANSMEIKTPRTEPSSKTDKRSKRRSDKPYNYHVPHNPELTFSPQRIRKTDNSYSLLDQNYSFNDTNSEYIPQWNSRKKTYSTNLESLPEHTNSIEEIENKVKNDENLKTTHGKKYK